MLSVEEAITGRRSIRAFLPKPVPREIIGKILLIAGRAPSGTNIQPWKVWVLDGKVRDQVVGEMKAGHDAGDNGRREYHYDMQNWREPYLARRRACGFGLYNTIGIPRGDKERMRAQQGRNYQFFDAPVGLIFSIDRDLEIGSWVDYGMFLQSIMVAEALRRLSRDHRMVLLECYFRGCTAAQAAARIGVPVETVRNWEQGKRSPRGPARALLKLIEQAPEAAFAALGCKSR